MHKKFQVFTFALFCIITSYLYMPNKSTIPYSGKRFIMPRIVFNALAVSLDRSFCSIKLFVCILFVLVWVVNATQERIPGISYLIHPMEQRALLLPAR